MRRSKASIFHITTKVQKNKVAVSKRTQTPLSPACSRSLESGLRQLRRPQNKEDLKTDCILKPPGLLRGHRTLGGAGSNLTLHVPLGDGGPGYRAVRQSGFAQAKCSSLLQRHRVEAPSPLCFQNEAGESLGQGARPAPEPCRTFVVLTEIKRRSQRPETREIQVGHKESSGEKESSRMCC